MPSSSDTRVLFSFPFGTHSSSCPWNKDCGKKLGKEGEVGELLGLFCADLGKIAYYVLLHLELELVGLPASYTFAAAWQMSQSQLLLHEKGVWGEAQRKKRALLLLRSNIITTFGLFCGDGGGGGGASELRIA